MRAVLDFDSTFDATTSHIMVWSYILQSNEDRNNSIHTTQGAAPDIRSEPSVMHSISSTNNNLSSSQYLQEPALPYHTISPSNSGPSLNAQADPSISRASDRTLRPGTMPNEIRRRSFAPDQSADDSYTTPATKKIRQVKEANKRKRLPTFKGTYKQRVAMLRQQNREIVEHVERMYDIRHA